MNTATDASPLPSGGVQLVDSAQLGPWLARSHGKLRRYLIDLSGCRDKAGVMAVLAAKLPLPAEFGANWDALADSLRDLVLAGPAAGTALVLAHADGLRVTAPADFDRLLAVLDDACAFADAQQHRLLACVGLECLELPRP